MKTIFTIILSLALLLPLQLNAQTASKIPSLEVGGRTFTDLNNLIIVHAQVRTAAGYTPFRKDDGTNYTPSVGKSFRVLAMRLHATTASAGIFLFTTTVAQGEEAGAAAAGRVDYNYGFSTAGTAFYGGGAGFYTEHTINWLVGNSLFPGMFSTAANSGVWLYGYEE